MTNTITLDQKKIAMECLAKSICLQKFMYGDWPPNLQYPINYVEPDSYLKVTQASGGIGFYVEGETLLIAMPGIGSLVPVLHGLSNALEVGSGIFSIKMFSQDFLPLFDQNIMDFVRNLCMANPQVRKLRFTGFSYGTGYSTAFTYIFSKIIEFYAHPNFSTLTSKDIDYLCQDVLQQFKEGDRSAVFLQRMSSLSQNSTDQDILYKIRLLDREIFSKITIDGCYNMAVPTFYTRDFMNTYNQTVINNTTLYNLTYNYYLRSDPIATFGADKTAFGQCLDLIALDFKGRCIPGQMISLPNKSFAPKHAYTDYYNYFNLNYNVTYPIYDWDSAPVFVNTFLYIPLIAFMFYRGEVMSLSSCLFIIAIWFVMFTLVNAAVAGIVYGLFRFYKHFRGW